MKFLREWLHIERPSGIATHASQTLELDAPYAQAVEQCVRGIEDVLGGIVRERSEERGSIEATFGLINSERLTCTLERIGDARTRVTIVSRRGATAEPAKPSQYVQTLAAYLSASR